MKDVQISDISDLPTSKQRRGQKTIRQIEDACHDIGFMYIRGHGIAQDMIAKIRGVVMGESRKNPRIPDTHKSGLHIWLFRGDSMIRVLCVRVFDDLSFVGVRVFGHFYRIWPDLVSSICGCPSLAGVRDSNVNDGKRIAIIFTKTDTWTQIPGLQLSLVWLLTFGRAFIRTIRSGRRWCNARVVVIVDGQSENR